MVGMARAGKGAYVHMSNGVRLVVRMERLQLSHTATSQQDRVASQKVVVFVPRHHAGWMRRGRGKGTGTAEQGSDTDTARPGRHEQSHENKDPNVQGQEGERNRKCKKVIERLNCLV